MKEELGLSDLIDGSEEVFKEFCQDKDLGYLNSFHNLITQTYNEVQKLKDELVSKMKNKEIQVTEDNKNILKGLYDKLLRVETRVFILRDLIKERALN